MDRATTGKTTTKDKIIKEAIRLFAEKGFNGTTTKEIAESAGINEALIFRHFSTKRDLYSAIIKHKIDNQESIEMPVKKYGNTKDDWLIFEELANNIITYVKNDPEFIRLLYFSGLEGHELSDIFLEGYIKHMRSVLREYIGRRISEGDFKEVNPSIATRAFLGMVGNYVIHNAIFSHNIYEDVEEKELVRTFTSIFLKGIKK